MENLLRLAITLAQAFVPPQPPKRRIPPVAVGIGVGLLVLCGLVANVCLFIALWRFLLPILGEVGTPLAIAGLATLKALAIVLWLRFGGTRPEPVRLRPSPAALIAAQLAEAEALVKEHKTSALVAALLAGLMAARGE